MFLSPVLIKAHLNYFTIHYSVHYTGSYDYSYPVVFISRLWPTAAVITCYYVHTPTPVPDESSSSSSSSDQLSVGVFAGVAVGALIAVILGVVFITVPIVLWRRRSKEYALSAPEVQENQAYGVSTGLGLEKNPAYGAFGMVL